MSVALCRNRQAKNGILSSPTLPPRRMAPFAGANLSPGEIEKMAYMKLKICPANGRSPQPQRAVSSGLF